MRNYICGGDKYFTGREYICLSIAIDKNLPKTISVEGIVLNLKNSFHVSLICVKELVRKYGIPDLEQKILDKFCNFVSKNEISFIKFTGEFRFSEFEEKRTLIAMCEVSNLEKFSKELSQELSIDVPTQPTHVTLYTLQPNVGIGLNSYNDLEQKSKIINVPEEIKSLS